MTPAISKRIAPLWSLANIATLIGLVGTITGLIGTFKSLGAASPEMKQLMLSKGISEAMNNTAFGLTIAVVCIVAHLMLTSKAKQMIEEIEYNALRLENLLVAPRRGRDQPPRVRRASRRRPPQRQGAPCGAGSARKSTRASSTSSRTSTSS